MFKPNWGKSSGACLWQYLRNSANWPNQVPFQWRILLDTFVNLSPLLVVLPSHCYNICYLKYFSHTFFLTRLCDNPALLVVWEEARIWTQGTQNVSPFLDFCSGACATASSANEYCFAVDTTCTLLIRGQMLRAQRALAIKSPCVLPSALWQDLVTAGDKLILVSKSWSRK